MGNAENNGSRFDLDRVAAVLEGLEESIIYRLLDRAQFAVNEAAYKAGHTGFRERSEASLFLIRLAYQEEMDARFGRYLVPEEKSFSKNLPSPERLPPLASHPFPVKDLEVINQGRSILRDYLDLLSRLCPPGDDGHYGSSVEIDVYTLQALARRIHYGALYVSESKFREKPDLYRSLAAANDRGGMLAALTRQEVEDRILLRLRSKLDAVQREVNTLVRRVVDPELIMDFYRNTIIRLTKEGELAYLRARALVAEDGGQDA